MHKRNNIEKVRFWNTVSKVSTVMCILTIVALQFFSKYLNNFLLAILIIGSCSVLMFILSQLMKFILKNKSHE